jgi:hypothetical protein
MFGEKIMFASVNEFRQKTVPYSLIKSTYFFPDMTASSRPKPRHYRDLTSQSDTPHSVGFLWRSKQPETETSTRQHTTIIVDIHASGEIRTRNSSKREAADPCP